MRLAETLKMTALIGFHAASILIPHHTTVTIATIQATNRALSRGDRRIALLSIAHPTNVLCDSI
jgi:hypothetical protein